MKIAALRLLRGSYHEEVVSNEGVQVVCADTEDALRLEESPPHTPCSPVGIRLQTGSVYHAKIQMPVFGWHHLTVTVESNSKAHLRVTGFVSIDDHFEYSILGQCDNDDAISPQIHMSFTQTTTMKLCRYGVWIERICPYNERTDEVPLRLKTLALGRVILRFRRH